ncbi:MAG TPA: phosphoribosylanthranilate isomerase [Dehalococcoidia bacterium]|nr:phosphoribosylanthranilate isomerase [Dehalococcoidia bacterium]
MMGLPEVEAVGAGPCLVKICGVTEPQHARAAAALGADFVGVVFAPSRRQVTLGQAQKIAIALGKLDRPPEPLSAPVSTVDIERLLARSRPLLVGVFADQDSDTINAIADQCRLDIVQLSGSEPWQVCFQVRRPVFKCLKVRPGQTADEVLAGIGQGAVPLLDPYVPGAYGGTGQMLDWTVAAAVAREVPIILAGGLTPDNVAEAVRKVRPWAVDVSSGVETEGVKDLDKVRAFILAAKAALTTP